MTCGGPHRIDAAILVDETDAGESELVNLGLLLRREFALDADEAPSLLNARAEIALVDVASCSVNSSASITRLGSAKSVAPLMSVASSLPLRSKTSGRWTVEEMSNTPPAPGPVAAKPSVTSRAAIRAKESAKARQARRKR
jgi:hypothetical protein